MGPVLTGGEGVRDYIYVEHFTERETRGGGMYGWAHRRGDYKIVVETGQDAELYNLADDPMEQTNLLADGGTPEYQAIANTLMESREAIVQ